MSDTSFAPPPTNVQLNVFYLTFFFFVFFFAGKTRCVAALCVFPAPVRIKVAKPKNSPRENRRMCVSFLFDFFTLHSQLCFAFYMSFTFTRERTVFP